MSRTDPMMRFLGIRFDADELDLLGIEPTYISNAGIDAALASRLALVYDHPDGRSEDAEMVCKLLRDAADRLPHERELPDLRAADPPDAVRAARAGERAQGEARLPRGHDGDGQEAGRADG